MKKEYDVVAYFYWAPPQAIHKFLCFHKSLKEFCNVLTIIGEGEFGITKEQFDFFDDEYKEDVILQPPFQALQTLMDVKYKIAIFSSNGRKGFVNPDGTEPPALGARYPSIGKDIQIAKNKGALTIQISEMITDFYYGGADIASLTSPSMKKLHTQPSFYGTRHTYQWRPFDARPEPRYIYSNCLLWDNVDDCLPPMTKKQFCEKYGLDRAKDIFLYLPSSPSAVIHGMARKSYIKATQLDNVVIKLHPKEYCRLASGRLDHNWSYEICGIKDTPVLDPLDTHWAYKYADLAMTNQSSISIEMCLYDTTCLYIEPPSIPWGNLFFQFAHRVSLNDFEYYVKNKLYKNKIQNLSQLCDIVLIDKNKTSIEILSEQIKELLNDCIR
jgi:hypothetical protein